MKSKKYVNYKDDYDYDSGDDYSNDDHADDDEHDCICTNHLVE